MAKNEKTTLSGSKLKGLVLRWLAAFAPTQIENGKLREGALSFNEALAKCQAELGEDVPLTPAKFRGLATMMEVKFDVRKSGQGNKSPVVAQLFNRITNLEQRYEVLNAAAIADASTATTKFDVLQRRLENLELRLRQTEDQIRGLHVTIDNINTAISRHNEHFDVVDSRLDRVASVQ